MAKNIIELFDEYKRTYNYLLKKKEKHPNKAAKIEQDIIKHQKKYADLWLNIDEEEFKK